MWHERERELAHQVCRKTFGSGKTNADTNIPIGTRNGLDRAPHSLTPSFAFWREKNKGLRPLPPGEFLACEDAAAAAAAASSSSSEASSSS